MIYLIAQAVLVTPLASWRPLGRWAAKRSYMAERSDRETDAFLTAITDRKTYTCSNCEREFASNPLRDMEQVSWLGDKADTWCSLDCMDEDAERRSKTR